MRKLVPLCMIILLLGSSCLGRNKKFREAYISRDYETMADLIGKGVNIYKHPSIEYSRSYLSQAISENDTAMATFLLDRGFQVNFRAKYSSSIPLFHGITQNNYEMVEILLEYGADINAIDDYGDDVLRHAMERGVSEDLFLLLLGKVEDIARRDSYGETMLDHARRFQNKTYYIYLLQEYINRDIPLAPLYRNMAAFYTDDVPLFESLISSNLHQQEIYLRGTENYAVLVAAETGAMGILQYLHELGQDLDMRDAQGMNALMHGAVNGKLEIVQYCMAQGMDLEARDAQGRTVLFQAASRGKPQVVQYCIDQGANMEARDHRGRTPLLMIVADATPFNLEAKKEVVQILLDNRADLTPRDEYGLDIRYYMENDSTSELFKPLFE